MTAPTHVTGSLLFTGFFCSLADINIFSDWKYLAVTIFTSLLPDIDHTKSFIGKLFFFISRPIQRHYGHRTITHSLLFLVIVISLVYLVSLVFNLYHYTSIVAYSLISHYILDMVTVQGIPLLYPFKNNPAVIPGNVDYRMTTGNLKHEGMTLFIFGILTLFLQPLFANGFWTSYNQTFGDIDHIQREFKSYDKLLMLDYDFNYYDKNYKGKAYLIDIDETKSTLYLFDSTKIITIDNLGHYKINSIKIIKTSHTIVSQKYDINNISLDSFNHFLENKLLKTINIRATTSLSLLREFIYETKKNHNLEYMYNLEFIQNDSTGLNLADAQMRMGEYSIKIEQERQNLYMNNLPYHIKKERLAALLRTDFSKLDDYSTNEIKNEIIELNKFLKSYNLWKSDNLRLLEYNLHKIQNQILHKPKIIITGQLETLSIK